ncbi:hypothetical protein H6P81_008545 [Aristolochia fimbriata]|uniref:Cardiolipin synthase N-terminal domain-containing protein n=1 Tax=Aristolochia fimbriata TaxID=158543 RepID=A0AAV7EIC5_ARIFI|nr:hypothetical protein H6P81_008545 [Aristolochia fimbriata]
MPSMASLLACHSPVMSPAKALFPKASFRGTPKGLNLKSHLKPSIFPLRTLTSDRNFPLHVCYSTFNKQNSESLESEKINGSGKERDWTTSILIFGFWAGLMYYVFMLAPNQTPSQDMYFLQKLCFLKGNDGFRMNEVLVSLWYIMAFWPLVYTMLLIPSGRSSNSKTPVWPFLMLSCFGGAYALIPYFVLWKPPPPTVKESDLESWPLKFLESKITAAVVLAAGLALITYAGLAGGDMWKEFFQYFRESKLIHITSLDFSLLSAFSTFWVYNDMTARKGYEKGSWLLPLSLLPYLGPALYLLLRPPLSTSSIASSVKDEND